MPHQELTAKRVRGAVSVALGACRAEPGPVEEFRAFKRNTRWYGEHWLRSGARHEAEHFVVAARLDKWIARVEAAGSAVLDKLRALVLAEPGVG